MKIVSGEGIPPRVLIKKLESETVSKSGLSIPADNDELPKAEILAVSDSAKDIVSVGDKVYFIESREKGQVKYEGKNHFIIPVGQLVAII